jgi:hypothetical protein
MSVLPVDDRWSSASARAILTGLTADRRAAFEAFERLPGESNLVYTPYIDCVSRS